MSKCNDCKYNSGLCKVCIKNKLFYVGKGLIERNKITTVYDNKIVLKDIREYTSRLEKCVNKGKE